MKKLLFVAFAALGALALLPALAPATQESAPLVKEKRSKVEFAAWGPAPGTKEVHTLVGVGLRTKTVFKVKVYAFGLYVHGPSAREKLAAWKGKSAEELQGDASFYQALLKGDFGKSLRLVLVRDVDGEDMREAFEDSLAPRVKAAKKDGLLGGAEALETFRGFFDEGELSKKSEIIFTAYPGGRLITIVNGEVRPEIENEALARALFDIYLGSDPIHEKAKKTLIERFPAVLDGTFVSPDTQD